MLSTGKIQWRIQDGVQFVQASSLLSWRDLLEPPEKNNERSIMSSRSTLSTCQPQPRAEQVTRASSSRQSSWEM